MNDPTAPSAQDRGPQAPAPAERRDVVLPGHGSCYICGSENPAGLGVVFRLDGDRVKPEVTLTERQQGPPGHAHGGCLAAVLDEAMGAAVWCAGHPVVAARLEVDFRKAVPLGASCTVIAWVTSVKGRKIWAQAEVRAASGALATQARGLYIEARHVFDKKLFVPKL